MRRRIVLGALAVTSLIAIAFVVPLAALVDVVAADRAMAAADQEARALAAVVASATADTNFDAVLGQLNAGTRRRAAIVAEDGSRVGADVPASDDVLARARDGNAFTTSVAGGRLVLVPVRSRGSTSVGVVFVPSALLHRGVHGAWLVLAAVAVATVTLAVAFADRLARSIVRPIETLASVAHALKDGDVDARVEPAGPPETVAAGDAFNRLADRIDVLLAHERETAADISHRLRTPLTALGLEAGSIGDEDDRARIGAAVARLTEAVTDTIAEARRPRSTATPSSDLAATVRARLDFWSVLAEDQGRRVRASIPDEPVPVALDAHDLTAAVDALLDNVFSHTAEGVAFGVTVSADPVPRLVVEDDGPGIGALVAPVRGASPRGSTGLGLDIVAKTAASCGGALHIDGARFEVTFRGLPRT